MTVTALLVSHDGARWLPAVLEGLGAQTRRPDRVVAVDTGSTDASLDLLRDALGPDAVVTAPPSTSFPDAVTTGLAAVDSEWLWLLHDDSRPAPDALERLLEAASAHPGAAILGPKLREWPSLRRLLEVGVTMSGTGRREVGLERGEYDQGQHDRTRQVLAVSSAGMLVRRDVLEQLGGFDRRLPLFGNDLDLGWRAARAGHTTVVVPEAVVFHAEAAHRGVRRTPVTGNHRRGERRAALYTLLVNCSLAALPFLLVRLLLGSLLRATGLVLVRAPGEALDELVALVTTCLRPDRIVLGRRARRRTSTVPASDVRPLLAPWWVPYRHGLDFVSDLAMAVAHSAADVSTTRRAARVAATETGPVPAEAQNLPADSGLVARLLSSRTAWLFAGLVVLAVVAARGLVGAGVLSGGALLPAPPGAVHWWRLYLEPWHEQGLGSGLPAAPYLLPLAVAGTVLAGKAWLVVDLLFLLTVPAAAWGAARFLRPLVGDGWPRLWGATAYALVPVVSGAVAQGRLGSVAAAVLLPWVAHAALFLGPGQDGDRRWRAAWRTALLLAVLTAFVPLAWPVAAVLAVVAGLVALARRRSVPAGWAQVLAALAAVPVLLLPWSALRFRQDGASPWYAEAGLPARDLVPDLGAWEVVAGRAADTEAGAAPLWFGLGLALAALAALLRSGTRPVVLRCWAVVVVGLATAALLDADGAWAGFPVLLVQGAFVTAAAVAGVGVTAQLSGRSFGWQQPVGLLTTVAAVLTPVVGLLWWAAGGAEDPLDRGPAHRVPAYMVEAAVRDGDQGILLVRSEDTGLGYTLLRSAGARVGDDTVLTPGPEQDRLTTLVGDLASAPSAETVAELSRFGVEFVYLPPPAPPELVGNLDSVSGLTSASAMRPGSRAWQLEAEPTRAALPEPEEPPRRALLVVQGLALAAALVLAAPSRRVRR